MKTFIKAVTFAVTVEAILFAVAYLIITCTSCAREIGLCMIYAFGILTTLSMGCMITDIESKLGKFLLSLLFVGIYCMMQSLVIIAMLH